MNGKPKLVLVLVFVLTLLLASAGLVWAKELGALTVSGPGIKGQVDIDGQQSLSRLEMSGFFEPGKIVTAPEGLGEGYTITQHLVMESGPIEWQELVYYPGSAGLESYIYWVGPLSPDAPQNSDRWTVVQPEADEVMRSLLKAYGVTVVAAVLPQVEANQPASEAQPAEGASAAAIEAQPEVLAPAPAESESNPAQPPVAPRETGGINGGLVWAIASLALLAAGFVLLRFLISPRREPARAGVEGQD
jgi:hypothetical protein